MAPAAGLSASYAVAWCFTLNNYTDLEYNHLVGLGDSELVKYLVFGKEMGLTQTPHLQGFVKFSKRLRVGPVKLILGTDRVHIEVARDQKKAAAYCMKDGDYREFGDALEVPGRRSDLDDFKDTVKAGNLNLASLRELHSEIYAKYPRFCIDYIADHSPQGPLPYYPLRLWQDEMNQILIHEPDPRKIMFCVDSVGNTGKSWFARYYSHLHANAQVITPGKKLDMAHVLRCDIRVLFMDAPRSKQGDFIQYDFLEEVKNGLIASYKYESRMKTLAPVHIVVMMNEQPDFTKLSMDRYDIINLNDARYNQIIQY